MRAPTTGSKYSRLIVAATDSTVAVTNAGSTAGSSARALMTLKARIHIRPPVRGRQITLLFACDDLFTPPVHALGRVAVGARRRRSARHAVRAARSGGRSVQAGPAGQREGGLGSAAVDGQARAEIHRQQGAHHVRRVPGGRIPEGRLRGGARALHAAAVGGEALGDQ